MLQATWIIFLKNVVLCPSFLLENNTKQLDFTTQWSGRSSSVSYLTRIFFISSFIENYKLLKEKNLAC